MNQQEFNDITGKINVIEQQLKTIEEKLNERKKHCKCYNILLLFVVFGIGLALIAGAAVDYREENQNITKFGRDMMITFGVSICLPYICVLIYALAKQFKKCQNCCDDFKNAINEIVN